MHGIGGVITMSNVIHIWSIVLAVPALAVTIWLLVTHKRKAACGWGVVTLLLLAAFALYYVPFQVRLDTDSLVLVSYQDGPHLVINNSVSPDDFSEMDRQLEGLTFRRPFLPDERLSDAFRRDTVTVNNADRNIFVVFPSDGARGYAVLDDEAIAEVTEEFIQYLNQWNKSHTGGMES